MQTHTRPSSIGRDRHYVTFESPGEPIPDGEGGFTLVWTPLVPEIWRVRIRPATPRDAEFVMAGTVINHLSHIVHGRFHPGVTTKTRMHFRGRIYHVTSVENLELRDRQMVLIADLQG